MEKAKSYFDKANAFMVIVSSDESIEDINEVALEILGYVKENVLGKNWFETLVPSQNRESQRKLFHDTLNSGMPHVHFRQTLLTKGGKLQMFDFHNILVNDSKGKTVGMLSSGADITQPKKAETEKAMEERLRDALDYMIEGCQIIDRDWRYVYVNNSVAAQGKKSKQELLGHTMMQAYPGIDSTPLFYHLRNCMVNRVSTRIENEFTFPDGTTGWFELRIEPVPEGILVFSVDITNSKTAEAELSKYRNRLEEVVAERTVQCGKISRDLTMEVQQHKKTEEALRLRSTILDNVMEAIFLVNSKGDFAFANKSAQEAYGYDLDEFLNQNIVVLLPSNDAPSVEKLLKHISEKGQTALEMIHVRKDGVQMPVKVYANVVKTTRGQFTVFVIRRLYYR